MPHSYRLRSNSFPLILPVSWCDNVGVSHYWNEVSTSTVSSWWKKVSLLPRNVSLLVNMYEKFVLACLSRQISG